MDPARLAREEEALIRAISRVISRHMAWDELQRSGPSTRPLGPPALKAPEYEDDLDEASVAQEAVLLEQAQQRLLQRKRLLEQLRQEGATVWVSPQMLSERSSPVLAH